MLLTTCSNFLFAQQGWLQHPSPSCLCGAAWVHRFEPGSGSQVKLTVESSVGSLSLTVSWYVPNDILSTTFSLNTVCIMCGNNTFGIYEKPAIFAIMCSMQTTQFIGYSIPIYQLWYQWYQTPKYAK